MEKLQSSRPWMRKINESSMMARSDYNDVFGVPPWHSAPFPVRLVDYSEIFDATASTSSIPVLDLSMVEDVFEPVGDSAGPGGGRTRVDYLDIFGSVGGEGFAASYEELFVEPKKSGVSSSDERTRWDVLSEQQEKEAFKHSLKVYTENNEPNLEMNQHSSFPRQQEDVSSKKPCMSSHRMSQETIDNVISDKTHSGKLDAIPGYSIVVDAIDPVQERKTKAVNIGTVDNTGSTGYTPYGGQKKEAAPCYPAAAKNFAVNSPESISACLLDVPGDEKQNSRSHSFHSTSRGYILLHDAEYLRVSEISLQTKPCKVPPPSRPPPTLSMMPEHPKVLGAVSRVDGRSLKSKVNNQLHSSSEADEPIKGSFFLHDAEMDPSSAAAVSIAAINVAMEQAQVRLSSAKKLMDRKRHKAHWKVGPPNDMSNKEDGTAYEVSVKSCSKLIDANNSLKESNTSSECTFMERKEIRTGVKTPLNHEERKMHLPSCEEHQKQVRNENASKSFVEREEIQTTGKIPLNLEDGKSQLSSYNKDQEQVKKESASKSSEVMRKIVEMAGEWKTDKEYYDLLRNGRFLNTVRGIYIKGDEEKAKAAIYSCAGKEKYCNDSELVIEVQEKQKPMESSVCIEKLGKDNKLKGPSMEANENLADATMDEFMLKDRANDLEEDYGSLLSDKNQKQSEAHKDYNNENNANKPGSNVGYCLYEENIKKLQNSNIDFKPWVANGYCEENELQAAEMASGYVEYKRGFDASQVKCEVNESSKEVKAQTESLFHIIADKGIKEQDELCTFNTTDIEERTDAAEMKEGNEFQTNEEAPHILVNNEFEQETIQEEKGLVNGLEMPEAQEKIEDAELEKILNSGEGTCCKDCNEKETREARTALQKDEESMGALFNKEVKNFEFLATAEGDCDKRVGENRTEVPVLVETNISSNSADAACQLGGIEESDTRKVFLSGTDGSLLAAASDATEISHKPSFCMDVDKIRSKMNAVKERDTEPETRLEEKDLYTEKEGEGIVMERANYEAHEQVLAEAGVIAERIAVERAIAEARQRALAEARQKAGKATEAEKASREARLRAERAAVERATEEARKRAIEKALAEKAAADSTERTAQVSASNKDRLRKDNRTVHFKATHIKEDSEAKHKPTLAKIQRNAQSQTTASSANDHIYSDSHNNGGAESKLRCKARQDREQQTAERAAKALAERNMRDILAQREQAERDRLAESLDGEVRRWSSGKDGNLRALLSTLQHILGPDSGWQPIPPTDIMNASAVKKAYRRATLCVHPDKLQQRGASIHQKFICEKVFDLLQEAWNKFNSEER